MGLINVYSSLSAERYSFRANGPLRSLLPETDLTSCLLVKEGARVLPDYEVTEEDVIFIRKLPKGGKLDFTGLTWVDYTLGVLTLGVSLIATASANARNRKAQEEMEKQQKAADELAATIDTAPFLRGAKNATALGNTIPYVMGEMFHTPYLLNSGYYSIEGEDGKQQYWNAILCTGYNDLKIKSVAIGSTDVLDLSSSYSADNTDSQNGVYSLSSSIYSEDEETTIAVTTQSEAELLIAIAEDQGGSGSYTISSGYYLVTLEQTPSKVEISGKGELTLPGLSQKVVSEYLNSEVAHDYGTATADIPETLVQLAPNAQKVEVCIQFDGLREYDTDLQTWKEREVQLGFWWSNNADEASPTWNQFYLDCDNDTLPSYGWTLLSNAEILAYVASGDIVRTEDAGHYLYSSVSDQIMIERRAGKSLNQDLTGTASTPSTDWAVFKRVTISAPSASKVKRNSKSTIRFTASKVFSYSESFGKDIVIKVKRLNAKLEDSNANETCILTYVNTFCFDPAKSEEAGVLVPCSPLEEPFRSKVQKIGIRLKADESSQNVIDEINVICGACARTWDADSQEWSTVKSVTRNPAAWVLELLTSSAHYHSQFSDSELDLDSFGALYEYCDEKEFYCDDVLTKSEKKKDIIERILSTCGAGLIINSSGLYEIVIDQAEASPVALLNSQCIKSINVSKSLERKPTGLKVTYIDRESWETRTDYFMLDGRTSYTDGVDILSELALETVTTHDHAYKVAQRELRMQELQPRTIKVSVGMEGDCYPLYSTVLLQMKQLKQGIASSVLQDVTYSGTSITEIEIADGVNFDGESRYGVIIQAQSDSGRSLIYAEVTGSGFTRTLTLSEAIAAQDIMPQAGNTLSFGYLESDGTFLSVTNTMKIVDIAPGSEQGWDLTLRDYNSEMYEYGIIPSYVSNLSRRSSSETAPDRKVSEVDLQDAKVAAIQEATGGALPTATPDAPANVTAVAYQDYILFTCEAGGTGLNNVVARTSWRLYNGLSTQTIVADGTTYRYDFKRSTEGYPEADTLAEWTLEAAVVNTAGVTSEYSSAVAVDTSGYGTWELQAPVVTPDITDRRIVLKMEQPARSDSKTVYGNVGYRIRIKRNSFEYNGSTIAADSQWYCPATSSNPYPTSSATNVDNYKDTSASYLQQLGHTYIQTCPLYGQGTSSGAVDTPYIYDIQAYNEAGSSDWLSASSDEVYVSALCSALRDIVMAQADYKELYIEELSAITANLGEISDGSLTGSDLNYWNLSTKQNASQAKDYQGAFRVGGEDQYFEVLPIVNGSGTITGYKVTLKAGNIELTGESSSSGGSSTLGTYIYDTNNSDRRMELTPYGINIQSKNNGDWEIEGRCVVDSKGNLFLTNATDSDSLPTLATFVPNDSLTVEVFHLDTDTTGESDNETTDAALTFDGSINTSASTVLNDDTGIFEGTITKDWADEDYTSSGKDLVFLTKANKLVINNDLVSTSDGTVKTDVNDWNAIVANSGTWGCSSTIFKWE